MIPLLCRDAVRALDRDAVERLGLPSLLLMENAGRGAFEVIARSYPDALARVVVVGGTGQNGGDGWVLARHLWNAGHAPRALLVGERERVAGDARVNLEALERLGVSCTGVESELGPLVSALAQATLVVDALFGTGLDRPITGVQAAVIELINACAADVVALDLPSGIDADRGAVLGTAVRARTTVTFASHKRGLYQYPGAALAGQVHCVSIGVPGGYDADVGLIETEDLTRWLLPRARDAHKGSAGHVLVLAGSPGRTGAALLSGLGALRAGAGLVTLAPRGGSARAALEAKVTELMTAELPEQAGPAVAAALELARGKQAAVIGPGLGLDDDGRALGRELALALALPAVLDADALTAIGRDLALLRRAPAARVLTPHPGEAARLLGTSSAEVQAERYVAARRLAEQSGCVAVLKGAATIIAEPAGRMRVCGRGTPAMGVAGTGDVLSGIIAALLAHADAFDAAAAAVQLHALAGERAATADRGLLASELAAALPAVWASCRPVR